MNAGGVAPVAVPAAPSPTTVVGRGLIHLVNRTCMMAAHPRRQPGNRARPMVNPVRAEGLSGYAASCRGVTW